MLSFLKTERLPGEPMGCTVEEANILAQSLSAVENRDIVYHGPTKAYIAGVEVRYPPFTRDGELRAIFNGLRLCFDKVPEEKVNVHGRRPPYYELWYFYENGMRSPYCYLDKDLDKTWDEYVAPLFDKDWSTQEMAEEALRLWGVLGDRHAAFVKAAPPFVAVGLLSQCLFSF